MSHAEPAVLIVDDERANIDLMVGLLKEDHKTLVASHSVSIAAASFVSFARDIASCHHEKWDGTGYPRGLKGEEIPIAARLMALAGVYDALVSKRVYKGAFSHEEAAQEIRAGRGTFFDPEVVDAFDAVEGLFREISESTETEVAEDRRPVTGQGPGVS